jgi:peptidoglycan/LPS O-acetylase OafA/YrhL
MNKSLEATGRSALISPFYPALDGLRAVAFLMVFLVHYGIIVWPWSFLQWGWVGVDIFFVLSGFLITGILFDSLGESHFFRNFYIRRSLRIFPVYYIFWIALLLLTPILHIAWNRYLIAQAGYAGNFFYAGAKLGHHAAPGFIPFVTSRHPHELRFINAGAFWTLCVEEQFYLVWPLVIWLVRSRQVLLRICILAIIALPIIRLLYFLRFPENVAAGQLFFNSFFRFDTLLVGAAVALWLRETRLSANTVRKGSIVVACAAPLLLAFLYSLERTHDPLNTNLDPVVATIGYTLIALAAAALLLLAIQPSSLLSRFLQRRPLVALGRISYGMYLFHALPELHFQAEGQRFINDHVGFLLPVVAFVYTLTCAKLSFRFIESPFLRLKDRLAPRPGAVEDPPPYAVSMQ